MIRTGIKFAAYIGTAFLAMAEMGMAAEAAGAVLPSGGVNVTLAQGKSLETLKTETGDTTARIESILDRVAIEEVRRKVGEGTEEEDEELMRLVIAQAGAYVNIRDLPGEEGLVLGKLYNNAVGALLGEENGWYRISSGTVTGYVKADCCVAGEDAIELAKTVSTRLATVNTEALKVRREPGPDAEVLMLVPENEQLVVTREIDGWVEVDTPEGSGWIAAEYCELSREFKEAESREEEEERLAREAEERGKARKAAEKAVSVQAPAAVSGTGSELGQAVADYAVQFVGNPYVYGGTSLTKGADCSGFVMSVYAAFGVSLPHSSASDRKQGYAVDGIANAQPGDLVCYSGHVALYIGDGQIVHAANSRKGIIISRADYDKVLAVRRIF